MKKIIGLVFLSLLAISASAADLIALSNDPKPTMAANIVVEGTACPGVGATGFSSSGLLLSCQSGRWQKGAGTPDIRVASCTCYSSGCGCNPTCPAGYALINRSFSGIDSNSHRNNRVHTGVCAK